MSSLQIIDVFDSYYEGRKAPSPVEAVDTRPAPRREDEKVRAKASNSDRPVSQAA